MNKEKPHDTFLHWRLNRAELAAPPPPNSDLLIERLRPWWEAWPEKLAAMRGQLANLRVTYGHAAVAATPDRTHVPVPTIFVDDDGPTGTVAKLVFLSLRDRTLRIRFEIDGLPTDGASDLEITMIADLSPHSVVSAEASPVAPGEYRAEVDLPSELAEQWAELKVSDRMPFGLILFSKASGW
jgi:hypothetical protein